MENIYIQIITALVFVLLIILSMYLIAGPLFDIIDSSDYEDDYEDDKNVHDIGPNYTEIFDRIYDGLKWVESSNDTNAIGDDGKALGILQIRKEYWEDAVNYNPKLRRDGMSHEDCLGFELYSKMVFESYMMRQIQHQRNKGNSWLTEDQLVRIHNGGPSGHLKPHTLDYLSMYHNIRNALDQGFEPLKGTPFHVYVGGNDKVNLSIGEVINFKYLNDYIL